MKMSKEADYGNWVPTAMMKILWCATTVLIVATVLLLALLKTKIPGIVLLVITLMALCMTVYMQICRRKFDFNGGGAVFG